jgi:hypothetical protein
MRIDTWVPRSLQVAGHAMPAHAPAMFVVTEEDEAAIRAAYQQRVRDIIARVRHDGCGGRPGRVELVTRVDGASSLPVRQIVIRQG